MIAACTFTISTKKEVKVQKTVSLRKNKDGNHLEEDIHLLPSSGNHVNPEGRWM
jgi:hypothetical protein